MMVNSAMAHRGCGVMMEARSRLLHQVKCPSGRPGGPATARGAPRASIAQRCIDCLIAHLSTLFTALFVCGVSTLAVRVPNLHVQRAYDSALQGSTECRPNGVHTRHYAHALRPGGVECFRGEHLLRRLAA